MDRCDEHRTFPKDGTGLRQYPATVEGGHLEIDLNQLDTTTSSTTHQQHEHDARSRRPR